MYKLPFQAAKQSLEQNANVIHRTKRKEITAGLQQPNWWTTNSALLIFNARLSESAQRELEVQGIDHY